MKKGERWLIPIDGNLRVSKFVRTRKDKRTHVFSDVPTIEPLPIITCPCGVAQSDIAFDDAFNVTDMNKCLPFPLRPTLRTMFVEGDYVYVAKTCGAGRCVFLNGTVVDGGRKGCTLVTYHNKVHNVPFGHIYLLEYRVWSTRCKDAIIMWLHVGTRLKVVKDIRRMICIMVWETRDDREWEWEKKELRHQGKKLKFLK